MHPQVNSSTGTWDVRLCLGNATFRILKTALHFTRNWLSWAKHRTLLCRENLQFQTIIPPPLQSAQKLWSHCRCWRKVNSFLLFFFVCRNSYLYLKKNPISESGSNSFQKLEVRFSHSHKNKYCPPPIYLLTSSSPAHYCAKLFCLCSPVAHTTVFHTPHLKCEPFFSLLLPVELCL